MWLATFTEECRYIQVCCSHRYVWRLAIFTWRDTDNTQVCCSHIRYSIWRLATFTEGYRYRDTGVLLQHAAAAPWVKAGGERGRLNNQTNSFLTVLMADRSFRLELKSLICSRFVFRSWPSRLCAAAVSQGCRLACSTVIRLSTSTVRRLRMKSWDGIYAWGERGGDQGREAKTTQANTRTSEQNQNQ